VQDDGRIALKLPIRGFAVLILDVDEEVEVGIRPLNAGDDAGQRDRFVAVIFRPKGMMPEQGRSGSKQTTYNYDEPHRSFPRKVLPKYQIHRLSTTILRSLTTTFTFNRSEGLCTKNPGRSYRPPLQLGVRNCRGAL